MKEIEAYIRPDRANQVISALEINQDSMMNNSRMMKHNRMMNRENDSNN